MLGTRRVVPTEALGVKREIIPADGPRAADRAWLLSLLGATTRAVAANHKMFSAALKRALHLGHFLINRLITSSDRAASCNWQHLRVGLPPGEAQQLAELPQADTLKRRVTKCGMLL